MTSSHTMMTSIDDALETFEPSGWTPLAKAIQDATKDLSAFHGESNTNILFIVSDGKGMCGGNPVKAAKEIRDSNIQPIVNVIGFDVDKEGEAQLNEIAKAANGTFALVQHEEALEEQFEKAREIAEKWAGWKSESIQYIRDAKSKATVLLRAYGSETVDKNRRFRSNVKFALSYLSEKNDMDFGLSADLSGMRRDWSSRAGDIEDNVTSSFYDQRDRIFDQMREKIESKAEQNE
ncbi:vWA domain-containing protein [Aureibacillus halotolerans]|uniref:von Willebrand factor type A domain-containing protein n=1 Tax=Aureibacillus halotolerans TaxID=1508390 RepID=A0A4R6TWC0_9BACI|nr:VWA domain-containing protein [Aureibacillus halotolerans]TDQ37751.1 von Willebrand factor type A domain-containing protein [Aureibacillus halotolerans]